MIQQSQYKNKDDESNQFLTTYNLSTPTLVNKISSQCIPDQHNINQKIRRIIQWLQAYWFIIILSIILLGSIIFYILMDNIMIGIVIAVGPQQKSIQMLSQIKMQNDNVIQRLIVGISANMTILQQYLNNNKIDYRISQKYPYQASFFDDIIPRDGTKFYLLTTTQWSLSNQQWCSQAIQLLSKQQNILITQSIHPKIQNQRYENIRLGLIPGIYRVEDRIIFSDIIGGNTILNLYSLTSVNMFYISKKFKNVILNQTTIQRIQSEQYFLSFSPKLIKNYIQNMVGHLKEAQSVYQIQLLKQIKQLPFCLLVFPSDKYSYQTIQESIESQGYQNYKIISVLNQNLVDYYQLRSLIVEQCATNSYIMFIRSPLKTNSLPYLNNIHQSYKSWITYAEGSDRFEVFTFLFRIYQLLDKNDFTNTNKPFILKNTVSIQTIGLLQLCIDSNKKINKQLILQQVQQLSYFHVQKQSEDYLQRHPYVGIERLSQDMPMDGYRARKKKEQSKQMQYNNWTQITKFKIMQAIDRQQVWYLPQNNTIQDIQFLNYNQLYKISKYKQNQKQVRFCLTVLNYNNLENDRYIKALKSIVEQKYENYHIVFIDDKSDDNSLQAAVYYMKKINFPKERMHFVKNKKRNFATYNILNAAFNYCQENDIQLLIDGDDQLIGKYPLKIINSVYQQNPNLWIVHSNCKTNYYQPGWSVKIASQRFLRTSSNQRMRVSSIAPIRTWRVKLIRSIPIIHHKRSNGNWLDVMYDDALLHPLAQLATVQRIQYIPQILYEYNKYGGNDDSTEYKKQYRYNTYNYIKSLTPLKPLKSLNQANQDIEVMQQLYQGKGIAYQTINI